MTDLSMYEAAMGAAFARLHPALQRFHRLQGQVVLHGEVQTFPPANAAARLLAWCLGTPRRAGRGPIRFTLDAAPRQERWVREFPAGTMVSDMRLANGRVVESLGAARLVFALVESGGALDMRLLSLRFLGIPCPRWLMPRIVAHEQGEDDWLFFDVAATVPLLGQVTAYRGFLELPPLPP